MLNLYENLKSDLYISHNLLRNNPQSFIPILEREMGYFMENILCRPDETPILTVEGKSPYMEAISFLKNQVPCCDLQKSHDLEQAAEDHAKDCGVNGLSSHVSSDGRNLSDRIEAYCEWNRLIGQNIDFSSKTAEQVLISLLIDDGLPDRPHRKNLFNQKYNLFGIGTSSHKTYQSVAVIVYAAGVREKGTSYYNLDECKYNFPKDSQVKKNIVNEFQREDQDAPDDCVAVRYEETNKSFRNHEVKVTKKIYTLKNGSEHIIEIEDF